MAPRSYCIPVSVRTTANRSSIAATVYRFVLCSYPAFAALDMDIEQHRDDELGYKTTILAYSKKLRHFLDVLADEISSTAEALLGNGTLTNQQELELSSHYDTVKDMEKLWHICEIFHLNPSSAYLSVDVAKWFLSSSRLLPTDDLLSHLKTAILRGDQKPEQSALPGGADFWSTVQQLAVRGMLQQVSSVLQSHSVIRRVLENKRSKEYLVVEQLHELLLCHPYARAIHDENLEVAEALGRADPGKIAVDFKVWQERVWRLRQEASTLLAVIPELDTVLQILLGDIRTIQATCGDEWTEHVTGTLLYVYPPPLTRSNICKVLDDAFAPSNTSETRASSLRKTIRSIAVGDLGGVLRRVYEYGAALGGAEADSLDLLRLTSLLTTGHLAHLLVYGADMTELLVPLPSASLECSFPEEVFVEASLLLHELGYPLDLVVGYLQACPDKGMIVAQELLPRTQCCSDAEARALAATLRGLGFEDQARSVELSRAAWLLQLPRTAGVSGDQGQQGAVARALSLYSSAGEVSRIVALLDRTAFRLFHAVYSSKACFGGLCASPPVPAGPLSGTASSGGDGVRDFVEMGGWGVASSSSSSMNGPEDHLLLQMQETSDAVAAVYSSSDDTVASMARQLQNYLTAIRLRLDLREGEGGECLEEAGLLVYGVLASEALPVRYSLHLLDLAVWLDDTHDVYTTRLRMAAMVSERDSSSIYSKTVAFDLMAKLQAVLSHYAAGALLGTMSADDVQTLRLKVQGVWAATVAQESAVHGQSRRAAEEQQRSGPVSQAARQAYHEKNYAYEMLTGNTLIRHKKQIQNSNNR